MDANIMEHDGIKEQDSDEDLNDDKKSKSNNSSDSDSDSDQNDDEEEKNKNIIIQNFEEKIALDPFDFGSYTNLIDILRSAGDLNKLRLTRERLAEKFTLRPELWFQWIQDELNIAATNEEKKTILNLFERALKDFSASDLWLSYLKYSINNPDLLTQDEVRSLFETALLNCSKQINQSSKIYSLYINFELEILEKDKFESDSVKEEHLNRIIKIYKKQLSEPHKYHEDTWSTWIEWSGETREDLESLYQNSCEHYDKIQNFENTLAHDVSIHEKIDIILEYSKNIMNWKNGLSWVSSLFERVLSEICYEPSLWIAYIDTTSSIDKLRDDLPISVKTLFERALKSCPWSGPIWTRYLRALASSSQPKTDITALVERALSCPLDAADTVELWLEYITYIRTTITDWKETSNREKLSALCDRACSSLAQWFGEDGDPECQILKYCARLELLLCEDYERFQALWQDIRSFGNHAHSARSWLEFISVLRLSNQPQSRISKSFSRALERTKDQPELIAEAWLNFERDCGTWSSYAHAAQTVASKMRNIKHQRQQELATKSGVSQNLPKKRKIMQKTSLNKTLEERIPQQELVLPTKKVKLGEKSPESFKGSREEDPKTIFLSNLAYNLSETELRTWLKSTGDPLTIRLVKGSKGTNKGYAYVVFNIEQEAESALKRDREPLNGRPVFVSKIRQSDTNNTAFRYNTNLEPNKLFIKGLASTTKQEDLVKLFSKFGKCQVRLVTFRNGHSKGLAFVEYDTEADAKQALINIDGKEIDNNIISVQLSQPPVRKNFSNESSTSNNEIEQKPVLPNVLGGGRKRNGRGSAFFLPRAVTLKTKTKE